MAITKCPDCGGKLSTDAAACPHCGRPSGGGAATSVGGQPAPDKKKESSPARAGCLVIVVLLGAFTCAGLMSDTTDQLSSEPANPSRKTPAKAEPAGPQLLIGKWSWREEHGYAIAEGEVTNASRRSLENVTAVVTFKTSAGDFITSDDAVIDFNPILPNQTSPWKIMARWNPEMKNASVQFKTLFGGTLRAERNY